MYFLKEITGLCELLPQFCNFACCFQILFEWVLHFI